MALLQLAPDTEPIPGYTLIERIGTGGYGEVWKANVPGGLTKAIKFVYGNLDDVRATRELKALDRVRTVRHPFLLSLERVEIVDGQLVIVTELADMSLCDRWDQCRNGGQRGIPRDELLIYLHDAADALDYMVQHYGLQHLDVKPENLLLVGDHVKVADFGLVKELGEHTVSMMGGLTPVYAPPELFDGRPSARSDQYSLAIVYQHMLTGVLPFPGRTAAQLAAQHLTSAPQLGSLPAADRAFINRALEKDPSQRYDNCCELVDRLLHGERASSSHAASRPKGDTAVATPRQSPDDDPIRTTEVAGEIEVSAAGRAKTHVEPSALTPLSTAEKRRDTTSAICRQTQRPSLVLPTIAALPPIEVPESATALRPTVFIGLGGTAGTTLRRLRSRLYDRFGELHTVPAMQMLLLDTDARALIGTNGGDNVAELNTNDTLALPLRRPQEYRDQSEQLLHWLNRRWLYNIPRSLQTEGIRPLGRLAFVDHAKVIQERIREAIVAAIAPDAIQASMQSTGLDFAQGSPRVFVIASISGATGGGMVLDLGYAVRKILMELKLSDDGLCGIFTHATACHADSRELAVANTYATLKELEYFGTSGGGYPGDPACDLPPFVSGVAAFSESYVAHLGDDLSDAEFDTACGRVAEYLYLNTATSCGAVLDVARTEAHTRCDTMSEGMRIRTFGIHPLTMRYDSSGTGATEQVCRALLRAWAGRDLFEETVHIHKLTDSSELHEPQTTVPSLDETEIDHRAAEHAERLGLDTDRLAEKVTAAVRDELGGEPDAYFENMLNEQAARVAEESHADESTAVLVSLLEKIDALLGRSDSRGRQQHDAPALLPVALEQHINRFAGEQGSAIGEFVSRLVNTPGGRVRAATRALTWFNDHLSSLHKTLNQRLADTGREVAEAVLALKELSLKTSAAQTRGITRRWLGRTSITVPEHARPDLVFWQRRVQQIVLIETGKLVQSIQRRISSIQSRLTDLVRELDRLADGMATTEAGGQSSSEELDEQVKDRIPKIVAVLDESLPARFNLDADGSTIIYDRGAIKSDGIASALLVATRTAMLQAFREHNVAQDLVGDAVDPDVAAQDLLAEFGNAAPRPPLYGGAVNRLVVLPESPSGKELQAAIRRNRKTLASVALDSDGDVTLCWEGEQLSLAEVAAELVRQEPRAAYLAKRIHTRVDILWHGFE